jgi:hypothetical protein
VRKFDWLPFTPPSGRLFGPSVFNVTIGCVETTCDAVFDETNGSQKEQVDLDLVDDKKKLHVMHYKEWQLAM